LDVVREIARRLAAVAAGTSTSGQDHLGAKDSYPSIVRYEVCRNVGVEMVVLEAAHHDTPQIRTWIKRLWRGRPRHPIPSACLIGCLWHVPTLLSAGAQRHPMFVCRPAPSDSSIG